MPDKPPLIPNSDVAQVVATVRQLHRKYPDNWKAARREFKRRWQTQGGILRERNGYELNTACVIAALLYGHKDFVETLRIAFNLGWDADCDAATAATIVGVMSGRRWMDQQGWNIKDVYRNTTRDDMPDDETLTGLENLAVAAARLTIQKNGGSIEPSPPGRGQGEGVSEKPSADHTIHIYRIPIERPANIGPLNTLDAQRGTPPPTLRAAIARTTSPARRSPAPAPPTSPSASAKRRALKPNPPPPGPRLSPN